MDWKNKYLTWRKSSKEMKKIQENVKRNIKRCGRGKCLVYNHAVFVVCLWFAVVLFFDYVMMSRLLVFTNINTGFTREQEVISRSQ